MKDKQYAVIMVDNTVTGATGANDNLDNRIFYHHFNIGDVVEVIEKTSYPQWYPGSFECNLGGVRQFIPQEYLWLQ